MSGHRRRNGPRSGVSASGILVAPVILAALAAAGCATEEPPAPVPTAREVEAAYDYRGRLEATVEGPVAEIRATQERRQLERGGTLWAKVGPYILLFSQETRELFREYPGLDAVRVITTTPDGEEVARAYLHRRAQNPLSWREALNIAARARKFGTDRPGLLEELVDWGEEHTDYSYAPRFRDA